MITSISNQPKVFLLLIDWEKTLQIYIKDEVCKMTFNFNQNDEAKERDVKWCWKKHSTKEVSIHHWQPKKKTKVSHAIEI